jgi:2-dehydropantoate 2-reductase
MTVPPVLVMGAGSIGCFVGGRLAAAGVPVALVGRPRVLGDLRTHGLRLTDLDGGDLRVPATALGLAETPAQALSDWPQLAASPPLVLLCVKGGATAEAAAQVAAAVPLGAPALSLQNGIGQADVARDAAPHVMWLSGMVPFNVAELGPGHFHRGTVGRLAVQDHGLWASWAPLFVAAGLPLDRHADLTPVQWGKLLLNLNNPVNALSGLPLRAQLLQRGYRRVTAALQDEALAALAAAGIAPAQLTPVPPARLPGVLRLPTWAFGLVAARSLRIDPLARSSMADDLALGRRTEVGLLCGAVVTLAQTQGLAAPVNQAVIRLIEGQAERGRPYAAPELLATLGLSG